MSEINLITEINAPIQKCFDIARNVGIHQLSTSDTNEKAIAGRTSGLCELNDEITWEAKHLGIRQKLTVKITRMEAPFLFEDTMLKGAFKSMKHQHQFEEKEGRTYMFDVFRYQVPFGLIGLIFDLLVLKRYMRKFLESRNNFLKSVAEEK